MVALFAISLSSCAEKLLTPEQVAAEIQKGYEAGKSAVEMEMSSKCDTDFEARVTAEVDRMKAESATPVVQ